MTAPTSNAAFHDARPKRRSAQEDPSFFVESPRRRLRQRSGIALPGADEWDARPSDPPSESAYRMARVQVSDEAWSAFRASLGVTPASVALGRLVEREVAASRQRSAPDAERIRDAVVEAGAVAEELQALISRLESSHREA